MMLETKKGRSRNEEGYYCICKCDNCGKEFKRKYSLIVKSKQTYCNKKCRGEAHSMWMKGNNNPHWKGGKVLTTDGYFLILIPNHPKADKRGYVLEHRYVMEKHLGRYLKPEEVVHHKNGDRIDNRIENLELLQNKGKHMEIHNKNRKIGIKT